MGTNKQFAIIGLGRFGMSLLKELRNNGYEVLAIDNDEEKLNDIIHIATHAVQADATDELVLEKLGISEYDAVVVAVGQDMQVNILTALILKEMGVNRVIAKAQNSLHGKVLEKIGVDTIIYPERDMAVKLARSLASENIMDQIIMPDEYAILEMRTPMAFAQKSLQELDLRQRLNITVIAIKRQGDLIITPGADEILYQDDILVLIGESKDINKVSDMD